MTDICIRGYVSSKFIMQIGVSLYWELHYNISVIYDVVQLVKENDSVSHKVFFHFIYLLFKSNCCYVLYFLKSFVAFCAKQLLS